MKHLTLAMLLISASGSCVAQTMSGLCTVSESQHSNKPSTARIVLTETGCDRESGGCTHVSDSPLAWSRFTGVSPQAMQRDGSTLSAHLSGDAGELVCDGVTQDGLLSGRFRFTPSPGFPRAMADLGFAHVSPHEQLSFLTLDISLAWARGMKEAGVTGMSGLSPDRLIGMRAVGVTPEKAREARAMGFQPTQEDLIQMSIFQIDRAFVERMRARGMQDLTVARLVKIKMFRLDE